jgi:hypothetical protein
MNNQNNSIVFQQNLNVTHTIKAATSSFVEGRRMTLDLVAWYNRQIAEITKGSEKFSSFETID